MGTLTYQLLRVGPNQEAAVSRILTQINLEHDWFRVRRRVIHRGRLTMRILALFPGYMFVAARYLWCLIEQITGVRGFVRFGGQIETVPDQVVMDLRDRADQKGILTEDSLPYSDGTRVWVRIAGQESPGIFRDYLGSARALVDVTIMGRAVSTSARLGELRLMD